jgi:hypothetical protein
MNAIMEAPLSHIWPPCDVTDRRIECGAEGRVVNTGKDTFRHARKVHPAHGMRPYLVYCLGLRLSISPSWWSCGMKNGEDEPRHGAIRS